MVAHVKTAALLAVLAHRTALGARVRHNASTSVGGEPWAEKILGGVKVYNYQDVQKPRKKSDGTTEMPVQSWVLKLFANATDEKAQATCNDGVECVRVSQCSKTALNFVEVRATEPALTAMLERQQGVVEGVEPPTPIRAFGSTPWGILRVQGRKPSDVPKKDGLPRDGGKGVHVFVLDTGIRTSHNEFGGRAVPGFDGTIGAFDGTGDNLGEVCNGSNPKCAQDGNGHGTHCAATIAGSTYGIAKGATVYGVKVLGDNGGGNIIGIALAVNWVRQTTLRPAVASMSLGGPKSWFSNQAVNVLALSKITVVVAAGNENTDACDKSPASAGWVITVGSTTVKDERSSFSNYGNCVNIWAPGSDVESASHRSDSGAVTFSGTSMACPHVSGVAALILERNKMATGSEVEKALGDQATPKVLTGLKPNDKNRLLYTGAVDSPLKKGGLFDWLR